jgi:ketosteroid isomerase-like protein
MSEQNKQTALKFIKALETGDAAAAESTLGPDATAVSKGFSKIRGTRPRDQMVASIGAFKTLMPDGLKTNVKGVTAEGDKVIIEWEGSAKLRNGTPYNNEYVMVFTFKDGKIKQMDEYFCTKLVDDVLWPLISGTGF